MKGLELRLNVTFASEAWCHLSISGPKKCQSGRHENIKSLEMNEVALSQRVYRKVRLYIFKKIKKPEFWEEVFSRDEMNFNMQYT